MNAKELDKINKIAIFDAIINGENSASALMSRIEIDRRTLNAGCLYLQNTGLIYKRKEKEGCLGRYPLKYFPVNSHFCVYIEENDELFSAIFIDRLGNAVDRIDKRKNPIVEKQLILSRFIRDINEYDNKRGLCRGIFIDCYDETAPLLTSEFQRIKREFLIAEALKSDSEVSLFVFDNACILNLYGKLTLSTVNSDILKDSVPIEKTYMFSKPYYDDIFKALSILTTRKMRELI